MEWGRYRWGLRRLVQGSQIWRRVGESKVARCCGKVRVGDRRWGSRLTCGRRQGGCIICDILRCSNVRLGDHRGWRGRNCSGATRRWKGVPSGVMFWIVMWTSRMEELDAVHWPDFRVGPWSKLRQCGGTYFIASFKLYKWQCELLDIYPSTCIEAYHLFCPESHFLMGETVVVVRTTLVSNMTMAMVSFASSFIWKLLVGRVLSIILIIRHCRRELVLLSRLFSFWFHLLWCLSSFRMSWLFLSLIFMKNNSLLHSWPLGLTL